MFRVLAIRVYKIYLSMKQTIACDEEHCCLLKASSNEKYSVFFLPELAVFNKVSNNN